MVPMQAHVIADDISRYKVVRKDWFAYNPMRLNIGSIACWHGDDDALVSPDYVVFHCPQHENEPSLLPAYLDHFRRSTQWDAFTNEAGDGGVRVRIYYGDIAQVRLILPDRAEQQKIADCLSSLDALIAAEGDRLAALKDHKKGLMQQLFPAAGQTTPRFRFPEFRDARDWTEQSLSDRIELVSGLHLSPDEYDEVGDLPYFSGPADFTDNVANVRKWTNKRGNAALAGDIVIVVKGSGVGDFWRLALPRAAIGRQLMAIRAPAETSGFLYQALSRTAQHLKSRASGNLIPGLARPDILEMKVAFPPTHEEQVMISKCLTEVDTLIDDTCGKIETLKAHKSGLMQQLFPAPSEVST